MEFGLRCSCSARARPARFTGDSHALKNGASCASSSFRAGALRARDRIFAMSHRKFERALPARRQPSVACTANAPSRRRSSRHPCMLLNAADLPAGWQSPVASCHWLAPGLSLASAGAPSHAPPGPPHACLVCCRPAMWVTGFPAEEASPPRQGQAQGLSARRPEAASSPDGLHGLQGGHDAHRP